MSQSENTKLKFLPVFVAVLVAIAGVLLFSPSLLVNPVSHPPTSPVSSETAKESEQTTPQSEVNNNTDVQQTPYETALSQQARSDSQTLLAELLKNIKALKALRVVDWNSEAMSKIESLATAGDEDYAKNEYRVALKNYTQALEESKTLLNSRAMTAQKLVQSGKTALDKGMVAKAKDDFSLALLLLPDEEDIKDWVRRASVRDKVFALDLSAENNIRKNDLLAAKKDYLSIQSLDPQYKKVSEKIATIERQILDQRFKQAMSSGFTFLANKQLADAETAFNQAQALKPKSKAVSDALAQVEAGKIALLKQDRIDKAIALENSEKWQDAVTIYKELLNEDSSLVSAKVGKIRAGARASLDTQITQVLNDPLKLQQEKEWQLANSILNDARAVIDRGSLLTNQIKQLESVITRARTKITLALLSDNRTEVEIYRISKLGTFKEHAVALNPGRYVVVGKRNGYRDVRENLVIDGFDSEIQVNIACSERI
jgi:hypothetical protein